MQELTTLSQSKSFNGTQGFYSHLATTTRCIMRFAVYTPSLHKNTTYPVLYWLSGLTCTEENFPAKAGAQRVADELNIILVVPDTSPRGLGIAGEDQSYDLGTGAGFYVDATQSPWSNGYQMYSYITKELPEVINANFPTDHKRIGIFGHSMGGHGALIIALRNPQIYRSVSAFAPICSPIHSPWGQKALKTYLGDDPTSWAQYDAVELIKERGWQGEILVDQGTQDQFLEKELQPQRLEQACLLAGVPLKLRFQQGYNHSYYFIASFIEDHLRFHAKNLSR